MILQSVQTTRQQVKNLIDSEMSDKRYTHIIDSDMSDKKYNTKLLVEVEGWDMEKVQKQAQDDEEGHESQAGPWCEDRQRQISSSSQKT